MTQSDTTKSIRSYFSFRSPYAWLAAERLLPELGELGAACATPSRANRNSRN